MGMTYFHKEYNEYMTCTICGLKKYCKPDGNKYICFACAHGNFAKTSWKKK